MFASRRGQKPQDALRTFPFHQVSPEDTGVYTLSHYTIYQIQQPDTEALNAFVGKRFELMCADFLMTYLRKRGEQIIASGRWWGSVEVEKGKHEQREIDLIVETNRSLYIGECKWSSKKAGKKELEHLRQTASALKTGKPITFVLFDRAGFDIKAEDGLLLFDPGSMVAEDETGGAAEG